MNACSFFSIILMFFISCFANANDNNHPVLDCSKETDACDVVLIRSNVSDETNYDVKIISAKTGKDLFFGVESNTSMESISLQLVNGKYVFSKESSASGKNIESLSFYFNNQKMKDIVYTSIDNSVNSTKKVLVWGGGLCQLSDNLNLISGAPSLLSSIYNECNFTKSRQYDAKIMGSDLIFKMQNATSNSNLTAIALGSAGSTIINPMNLGCLNNCLATNGPTQYVGNLNEKIRISLYINETKGDVIGYYYYQSQMKKINLTGSISDKGLMLKTESGEQFLGEMKGSVITGIWSNSARTRNYKFTLYQSLF